MHQTISRRQSPAFWIKNPINVFFLPILTVKHEFDSLENILINIAHSPSKEDFPGKPFPLNQITIDTNWIERIFIFITRVNCNSAKCSIHLWFSIYLSGIDIFILETAFLFDVLPPSLICNCSKSFGNWNQKEYWNSWIKMVFMV
jgi:hypothetical protein